MYMHRGISTFGAFIIIVVCPVLVFHNKKSVLRVKLLATCIISFFNDCLSLH